jgi:putative transposase
MAKSKERNRTSSKYVYYALQLYSSGLSLRKTSDRLSNVLIRRNHVSIWNWIQRYKPKRIFQSRRTISEFIIDETLIKAGSNYVWLWVAIEPRNKMILGIRISIERSILVAEQFIQSLIRKYGRHNISTDGGTWYPQACRFLNVEHHIHSSIEKSFIERTIQYIKDRTECFDDYFPCMRINCKLAHIMNWLVLFVDMHNRELVIKRKIAK